MKAIIKKKMRHKDTPGKAGRIGNGKIWEALKKDALGAKGKFSPDSLSATISKFKEANGRPFKPNGKKPINRPK